MELTLFSLFVIATLTIYAVLAVDLERAKQGKPSKFWEKKK